MGVLNNVLSGRNRKRGLEPVLRVLKEHPQVLHREVQTPADITSALDDFAHHEVNVVAINGGDGTVQAVLTALFNRPSFETLPLLAILAGGTTNMSAGDVSHPGNPARVLARLLTWAWDGAPASAIVKRPVMRVEFTTDKPPQYGLFFSAAGIFQATQMRRNTRDKARLPGMRGGLGTAMMVGRLMAGIALGRRVLESSRIEVQLDSQSIHAQDCLALFVTTLERMALGIRPYWGEGPGRLRYTAVAYSPRHLIRAMPALLRGKPNARLRTEFGYTSHNAREVRLGLDSGFTLDGEIFVPEVGVPVVISQGHPAYFVRP